MSPETRPQGIPPVEGDGADALNKARQDLVRGLLYVHSRLNLNTGEALEALSLVTALVETLVAKGLITPEGLDEAKRAAMQQLAGEFGAKEMGTLLQTAIEDKYDFKDEVTIDCASRVPLCRAACCRLKFALSKQDVREGIIRWEMEKPYLIEQGKDGRCVHLDRGALGCSVWKNRPAPCRAFDCRRDRRIWVDFEMRIPNPDLGRRDWPHCVSIAGDAESIDLTAMENLEGSRR